MVRILAILAIAATAAAQDVKIVKTIVVTQTTTITPWDSSSGSSGDASNSLTADSLNDESSSSVDPSGSAESWGWKQAGSSGSHANNLLWLPLLALCCLAALLPLLLKPKPKTKKTRGKPAPKPEAEPLNNDEDDMATVAVDYNHDGKVDAIIRGVDRDHDGIPDVVQRDGYLAHHTPLALGGQEVAPPLLMQPLMTTSQVVPSYQMAVPYNAYGVAPYNVV